MPPLASVNNSGMSKGGMQTGGRFVVRSRTPPELERVSFFFMFSCNPVICNPDFLWLFQLGIYVGILSVRIGKTGFLGPWRKVIGYCRSVRMLPLGIRNN